MKNILTILFAIIASALITSCIKVIDVGLDPENDRLVVDGLITNQIKPFEVKLSRTLALDDDSEFPGVNNAFVTVSDDAGNLDTLTLQSNGVYKTNGNRQGVPGRTYYLTVIVDGVTYTAQDYLTPVPSVDSIAAVYRERGDELGVDSNGFYIYFVFIDPPTKSYYKIDMLKDAAPVLKSNQLYVFDDQFIKPSEPVFSRAPGRYISGEKAVLILSSLSEKGYDYLNGVALQLQNDGGFFSTPPANAPTNLSGDALGFFRASSISSDSLIVP